MSNVFKDPERVWWQVNVTAVEYAILGKGIKANRTPLLYSGNISENGSKLALEMDRNRRTLY